MRSSNSHKLKRRTAKLPVLLVLSLMMTAAQAASPYRINEKYENGDAFMRVRLLGAVELHYERVKDQELVELSGLAWNDDDEVLYALSDRGVVFQLQVEFDNGYLRDVLVVDAYPLQDADSERLQGAAADAEGLDSFNARNGIKNDTELLVSFERVPRVSRYTPTGKLLQQYALPPPLREAYSGSNRGLESVAFVPALGILTAPERPIADPHGNSHQIFELRGSTWSLPRFDAPKSSLVAIEAMADNSLVTLERSFISVWQPLQIILRRTAPLTSTNESLVKTEDIAVFNSYDGWRVDNFEGLTRHRERAIFPGKRR